MLRQAIVGVAGAVLLLASGCRSPYYADQGAMVGGLGGAGLGAIIGNQTGHPLAGAAIGAVAGTLTGAAVGGAMDDIEARNRAEIAARMGRPVAPGAVSIEDVIAMTRAGVSEEVIISHVRNNGAVGPLRAEDLIYLQQQGISPRVVQAMQAPPPAQVRPVVYREAPPVIIEERYYDPFWGPRYGYYRRYPPPRNNVSFGIAVRN